VNMVLVVGERPEQARALAERLGVVGLESIPCARDWKLAVRSLTSHRISLILANVDRSADSRQFFTLLREITEIPIVAMGPGSDTEQVIWYLDHGAEDYVSSTTPFGVLTKKLSALISANGNGRAVGVISIGDLAIDLGAYSVTRNGQPVPLTPIEFKLLRALAEKQGKVCTHKELLQIVWGREFGDCSHYLRVYMGYLRQKLEPNPRRPSMLLTQWGYGYRLVVPPPEAAQGGRARLRTVTAG
jgi:two-component system, OmpR family, KDP operon response regulator KdpE